MKRFQLTAFLLTACLAVPALPAHADTISDAPFAAEEINTETQSAAPAATQSAAPAASFIDIDTSVVDELPSSEFRSIPTEAAGAAEETSATAPQNAAEASTQETTAAAQGLEAVQQAPGAAAGTGNAGNAEVTAADTAPAADAVPAAETIPSVAETIPSADQSIVPQDMPEVQGITTTTPGPESMANGTGTVSAGAAGTVVSTGADAGQSVYGSLHAAEGLTRLDLGYTLVSPAVSMDGFRVAEGSVQLADGSWDTIPRGASIRYPYFKLIREETDSSGTGWYVAAMAGRRLGDYATPDGSIPPELWLKKSDCTVQNYMDLNTANETRRQIIRNAMGLLGCRYRYAGNGPDYFDCSGFVHYVMSTVGIEVPRTSTELCQAGTQVGAEGLRPGDIVGRPGHVGIYIGDGYFIHASESSTGVITESISVYERNNHFTNFVNVVGD